MRQTFCTKAWKNKSPFYVVELLIELAVRRSVELLFFKTRAENKIPLLTLMPVHELQRLESEMLIHLAQIKNHSINLNCVENIVHWCSLWKKIPRASTLLFRRVTFFPLRWSRKFKLVVKSFKFLRQPL